MPDTVFHRVRDLDAGAEAVHSKNQAVRGLAACLAVCSLAYLSVAAIFLSSRGFWSPDSAVRLVQVESLVRNGMQGLAVPYPAASIDPQGRYFPFGPWFHFVRNGRYYISYPPYFSAMVAPLYRAFGVPGLVALPVVSGLGAIWVTYTVLRRHTPELAVGGSLALGLATPLVIYSTVFWDHAPVVFLCSSALGLLLKVLTDDIDHHRRFLFFAGLLLGSGLWLRNEMYIFILAVVVAWICLGPPRRLGSSVVLVAGIMMPAGILWIFNRQLSGSLLGWKASGLAASRANGVVETMLGQQAYAWLSDKLGNLYYQLISPDYYAFNRQAVLGGVATAALFAVAIVLLRSGVARRWERVLVAGGLLAAATALLILLQRTDISGLLPVVPFLVLAWLPGPVSAWERFLWAVVCVFTAGIVVTGTHGGLQWGPRYLLPILPSLVWLVAAGVARVRDSVPGIWPSLRFAGSVLLGVSLLVQASGVDQVSEKMAANAHVNDLLRAGRSDIIVTPLEWITLGSGPVFFDKALMLVAGPDQFRRLVVDFSERRVLRWTYIPLSGAFFAPQAIGAWTAGHPYSFTVDDDRTEEGLRFVTFVGTPVARTAAAHDHPVAGRRRPASGRSRHGH